MGYKEKYEQALERARMINNGEDVDVEAGTTTCEYIFPELKEDEDEKIRKELIQYIKNWKANIQGKAYHYLWSSDKEECNKLLAWLEKQGEQKTQVHFPKFTFDDVLALQCCMETVKKVQEDKELYEQLNLIHSKVYDAYWLEKQEGCEHIKKEWTTSDAATLKEIIDFLENGTAKLQHDLTKYANWLKIQFTPIEKKSEQKSTWSEEDEEMFKSIMATCELAEQERDSSPARHLLEMQLNWLKSLKNRIKNGGY